MPGNRPDDEPARAAGTLRLPRDVRTAAGLAEAVRIRIERGSLLPGDRLPPVRVLATHLALAPNTVARAYRELETAGWLVGRGRAGTFVADRLPTRADRDERALADAADRFRRRAAQLGYSIDDAVRALRA